MCVWGIQHDWMKIRKVIAQFVGFTQVLYLKKKKKKKVGRNAWLQQHMEGIDVNHHHNNIYYYINLQMEINYSTKWNIFETLSKFKVTSKLT